MKKNEWGVVPQTHQGRTTNTQGSPQLPRMAAPDAAGSSYRLNQPVKQGGVNGVLPGPR